MINYALAFYLPQSWKSKLNILIYINMRDDITDDWHCWLMGKQFHFARWRILNDIQPMNCLNIKCLVVRGSWLRHIYSFICWIFDGHRIPRSETSLSFKSNRLYTEMSSMLSITGAHGWDKRMLNKYSLLGKFRKSFVAHGICDCVDPRQTQPI